MGLASLLLSIRRIVQVIVALRSVRGESAGRMVVGGIVRRITAIVRAMVFA